MEEPDTPQERSQIQTFVFLDLETTGLPTDSPRITELSMVAVSRTHLLQMKESPPSVSPSRITNTPPSPPQATATPTTSNSTACVGQHKRKLIPALPRVLHKYTRLYYPWKVIVAVVEGKSGLNNESLEHLPSFTEDSAQAISLFLDLPKPVALVAHNGNRYDFPLLRAELNKVNCLDKFLHLQCVDTLVAIKDIDALIEREDILDITKLAETFNLEDFEEELSQEAFSPGKRPRITESDEELFNTPPSPLESSPSSQGNNHQPLEVSPKPLMTPIKNHPTAQPSTPATPSKPAEPPPLPYTPNKSQSVTPGTPGFHAKATKQSSKVRRTLTYGKSRKKLPRLLYNQPEIYRRLFDSEYKAHRAEEDCMALLTICGHYGSKFVEWADTFATSFAGVKPMWVKRKSFHTSQEG